jgi:Capsule assembly protein Wzi/PAP2 superfamily
MGKRAWLIVMGAILATSAWGQARPADPSASVPAPPKKAAVAPAAAQASLPARLGGPALGGLPAPGRKTAVAPDFRVPPGKQVAPGRYSPGAFLRNVAGDQKAIWTSPARLRSSDLGWLVPLAGAGAGLLATDSDVSRNLSNRKNTLDRSTQISDYGVGALGGVAGGMYLWGKLAHNRHEEETGFLAIESLANALVVNNAVNFAAGRERPGVDRARGRFGVNGRSFPSNHAVAAWSIASVVAHEYPGLLTKLIAYGLAGAVSASRVSAKQHFPSDVFLGSAIGWLVGEEVYRARHDPDVGGGVWNTFREMNEGEGQPAGNRASAFVPLGSWVYPAVERLAAEGYVRTAMLGMRPWTRLECARLVGEAEDRVGANEQDPPEDVAESVAALEKEFAAELGPGAAPGLELTSLYSRVMGISGPPLTDGYHFGQTVVNDNGRPYGEGANVASGFTAEGRAGPFAVYLQGEYQHAPGAPALPQAARAAIAQADSLPAMPAVQTPAVDRFRLLDAYVAMGFHGWQVSFGRQSLWWGPGDGGPMLYSTNAEPITMLRVTRVSPFKLPGIFARMGPVRTEFFLGRLAGHEFIYGVPTGLEGQWGRALADQPMIHGEKISFKPTPNLEFGVSRTAIFAGAGVPLTWRTFLRSMVSTSNGPPGTSRDPGDNRSGFDMSYRLPGLRNWVTFYTDSFVEDQFSPLAYFDRAANSAGLYFPRLPKLGKFDLRVEGVYTDLPIGGNLGPGTFYANVRYRNGYTNQGQLLGNWVGRGGQGFEAWLGYHRTPQSFFQLSYRHEKVSREFIPYGGTVNDAGAEASLWLRANLSMTASLEYERWTFPVLAPGAETNVTSAVQVTFWPHWQAR